MKGPETPSSDDFGKAMDLLREVAKGNLKEISIYRLAGLTHVLRASLHDDLHLASHRIKEACTLLNELKEKISENPNSPLQEQLFYIEKIVEILKTRDSIKNDR